MNKKGPYSRSFTREFKFKSYYSRIKIIKFYEEGIGKIHWKKIVFFFIFYKIFEIN